MTQKPEPEPGVVIVEGMRVSIPSFALRFDSDGELVSGPLELHTGVDQTSVWFEISFDHVCASEQISIDSRKAIEDGRNNDVGRLLIAEMKAGMQAIACSCIAVDAFYANMKEFISIPEDTKIAWKKHGTARNRQIAEVLRLAFPMSKRRAAYVRKALQQNFSWRDQAIHPSSKSMQPAIHETLNKATDRRFALFRHFNAREIARLSLVDWASKNPPNNKYGELREYCSALAGRLKGVSGLWDERFGIIPEKSGT